MICKGVSMQQENLSILRALKENIEELIVYIEAGELESYGEDSHKVQSGFDLIMGELTMVVLRLTDSDGTISPSELEFLNDMRHVVFGYGIPELVSEDYWELQRQFLRIHPDRLLTLDHLPLSVRLLDVYDQSHSTKYGTTARMLFTQFADAIIKADNDENIYEKMTLENFKEILNKEADNGA
jgi:hypothetical protein